MSGGEIGWGQIFLSHYKVIWHPRGLSITPQNPSALLEFFNDLAQET